MTKMFTFNTEISLDSLVQLGKHSSSDVRKFINQSLVGMDDCNVPHPTMPGHYVENPVVAEHVNRARLSQAHWRINAGNEVPVTITIDEDGRLVSMVFLREANA